MERRGEEPRELGEVFARLGRDGQEGAVGGREGGGERPELPHALRGLHGVPLRRGDDRGKRRFS